MNERKRGLLAIPAHNEALTLKLVLEEVERHLPGLDVVVVDDGSTDATLQLLREWGGHHVRHLCNLGYGRAVQTAIRYAHRNGYDYVVTLDGDGQHPPAEAKRVLEHFLSTGLDLCIGSRFLRARRYAGVPVGRRIGMWCFSWVARLVTGQRYYDTTSGLKAIRRTVFDPLTRWHFVDFHVEAIVYLRRLGFQVGEHPVVMSDRRHGASMYSAVSAATYPLKTLLMVAVAVAQAALTQHEVRP